MAFVFKLAVISVVADLKGARKSLATILVGIDVVDSRNDVTILVDFEVPFGVCMETAKIKYELAVEKDPNIVVATKPELFGAVGADFHRDAHMRGKMEVVTSFGGRVVFGKIYVIERESTPTSVFIRVFAGATKSHFTADFFGKLFAVLVGSFMEPAIEIISGLNWIVTSNVGGENVVISVPGIDVVGVSRDG